MDWYYKPDDYCHSPADYQLCDRLQAVRQAADACTCQKAHNCLMVGIISCPWGRKIHSIARSNRDYAEACNRLWPWLFGYTKDGLPRLQTFDPTKMPERGLQRNFEIWLNNKLHYLLQDVYRDRGKDNVLSLDVAPDSDYYIAEPIDPQPLPWEQLETQDNRAIAKAFLDHCASQPVALDVTFGQKRTRDRGLNCNRYLALVFFGDTPYTQAQLAQEFGLSIDTVNDLVKKFRHLLREYYSDFIQRHSAAG